MVLAVNATGCYWNGLGWSQRGKEFLTVSSALRSLQEEGEDLDTITLLYSEPDPYYDTESNFSYRYASAL
jgi:hypothetical protein